MTRYQEDRIISSAFGPKTKHRHTRGKKLKGEIDKGTNIIRNINSRLPVTDRASGQKIRCRRLE